MAEPNPSPVTAHIERAIRIVGSESKLGAAAGYSQNAIWWAKSRGRVSAELAVAIERATDGQVSRHELRPDLFGAPAQAAAS